MKALRLLFSGRGPAIPMLLGNTAVSVTDENIIFILCCKNLLVYGPTVLTGVSKTPVTSLGVLVPAGGSVALTQCWAVPCWLHSQKQHERFRISGRNSNESTRETSSLQLQWDTTNSTSSPHPFFGRNSGCAHLCSAHSDNLLMTICSFGKHG